MHWARLLAGDVQNLLDIQLHSMRLRLALDATRTDYGPMHMRASIVVERPSSNGSVDRLREHGSVDEEVGKVVDSFKHEFGTSVGFRGCGVGRASLFLFTP